MVVCVHHWDAFTRHLGEGNPAGIVLETQGLSDLDMQDIAASVGFNDTAFVLPSLTADLRIRYFSPRREVVLCGHATIAAFAALHRQGMLPRNGVSSHYELETKAGILPIDVDLSCDGVPLVVMTQGTAHFEGFTGARDAVAHAIGITTDDLHPTLPIIYGSTGRWTLLVPVKNLQVMRRMQPFPEQFSAALTEKTEASIHPFCLETIKEEAHAHARHFSSPASGTLEDAVTGTASGVLGAYYYRFIGSREATNQPLVVEQGYEISREGTVQVWVSEQSGSQTVRIAGSASFVREIDITEL